MADLRVQRLLAASGGIDTDTAPELVANNRAPEVANFLVDRNGKMPMRGPLTDPITINSGAWTGRKIISATVFDDNILYGFQVPSASATRDPWVAPYRTATAAGDLSVAEATQRYYTPAGGMTTVSHTEPLTFSNSHVRVGDFVYGFSYSRVGSSATTGAGLQYNRRLLKWDGTATAPADISGASSATAPTSGQSVAAHYERLWVLGGRKPGTNTWRPNSLFWSDPGGPTSASLALWQDDVSGLTNEIVVGGDDRTDFGVALAHCAAGLVVLKRRSMYILRGYSADTWQIKQFSSEVGCIDPRSVVEFEDGVFFMSDHGFMYFDGNQITTVSKNISSTMLIQAIRRTGDTVTTDGGFCTAGALGNGYVGLSIGNSPATTSHSTTDFCAVFNLTTGGWSTLSTGATEMSAPLRYGRTKTKRFAIGDNVFCRADYLSTPELAPTASYGMDSIDASPTTIPSRWASRLVQLSEPAYNSTLHRILVDYTFVLNTADDEDSLPPNSGWYVRAVDGHGTVLQDWYQLPAQGTATVRKYRRQYGQDCFAEADDVQLEVECRSSQSPYANCTIHTVDFEYSTSRQRLNS